MLMQPRPMADTLSPPKDRRFTAHLPSLAPSQSHHCDPGGACPPAPASHSAAGGGAGRIGKAGDDFGRDRLCLDLARTLGMRGGPDALLEAFEHRHAALEQAMLHG